MTSNTRKPAFMKAYAMVDNRFIAGHFYVKTIRAPFVPKKATND